MLSGSVLVFWMEQWAPLEYIAHKTVELQFVLLGGVRVEIIPQDMWGGGTIAKVKKLIGLDYGLDCFGWVEYVVQSLLRIIRLG